MCLVEQDELHPTTSPPLGSAEYYEGVMCGIWVAEWVVGGIDVPGSVIL